LRRALRDAYARAVPIERIDTEGPSSITLWSDGAHRCVLTQWPGRFELLLHRDDRVIRQETCADEHSARGLAQEWPIALESLRYQ
jgi:hypothetical protein